MGRSQLRIGSLLQNTTPKVIQVAETIARPSLQVAMKRYVYQSGTGLLLRATR